MNSKNGKRARRELQRMRIIDALGMDPTEKREASWRNELLPLVTSTIFSRQDDLGSGEQDEIESAVSVALARVAEDELDQLTSLATAAQLLSMQGQFARLAPLGKRFRDLGSR